MDALRLPSTGEESSKVNGSRERIQRRRTSGAHFCYRNDEELLEALPTPVRRGGAAAAGRAKKDAPGLRGGEGGGAARGIKKANMLWWSHWDSNPGPLACHASALPTELWPRCARGGIGARVPQRVISRVPVRSTCANCGRSTLRSGAAHFTKICGRNTGRRRPYKEVPARPLSSFLSFIRFPSHGSCTRGHRTNGTGRRGGGDRPGTHDWAPL